MDSKNILKSKSFWFGLATTLAGAAWPQLSQLVDPETALMAAGIGTVVLRYLTNTGVVVLPAAK